MSSRRATWPGRSPCTTPSCTAPGQTTSPWNCSTPPPCCGGCTWRAFPSAVGLPGCRSLLHFGAGQYPRVLDELLPARARVHEFGGSHAQRDAVERTLLEAAIRAGRVPLASALVGERLANRERSTYAWSKRAQLLSRLGAASAASAAAGRQRELAADIQAAVAAP